jgi:mono/diheme cytochrome c family protein
MWTGFSYAMIGVANPPLERHVDWISFAAAQLVFGLVAAVVVSLTEKIAVSPAGPGVPADPLVPIVLFVALAGLANGCDAPGKPQPPTEPDRSSEVRDFGVLYQKHCSGCHGADGTLGPAPPLNDRLFLHIVPSADLQRIITAGRPGTPMPPFDSAKGGPLTDAQVKILADGLKTTWGRSGEPSPPTDAPGYTADAAGDVSRGATVFARACAGCHGDAGRGGTFEGRSVGAIHVPAYMALSSDQVLRRYVITGRPDLGMPDYAGNSGRPSDFRPLGAGDVADLTAFLASWRKSDAGK